MDVQFEGTNALAAAANGDFPLVVLLWGMAMAEHPQPPDLLTLTDDDGNSLLHYAASGAVDTTDTLHFLLQQAQASGRSLPELVDARNRALETPLMRAAHAGNLCIAEALLTIGHAALLAHDADGCTPAHHAAAQGHLWVLHYLLEFEKRIAPIDTPLAQLGGRCNNDNDVLDYASRYEHKAVVLYLLKRGYDPHRPAADHLTSLDVAQQRPHAPKWIIALLAGDKAAHNTPPSTFRQTRAWVALLYGSLLVSILATSYFLPWWLALPLIAIVLIKSLAAFRPHHGHSHGTGSKNVSALHPSKRDVHVLPNVSLVQSQQPQLQQQESKKRFACFFSLWKPHPELAMGIWIGWMLLFALFMVVLWVDNTYRTVRQTYCAFLIVVVALHGLLLLLWLRLALLYPSDPGVVATSSHDLPPLLLDAANGIAIDPTTHCRTCFVTKPLRSKHCAHCGVCIARLDHHCVWINRCVGYGNHRLFVLFLLAHTLVLVAYVALAFVVAFERLRTLHAERTGSVENEEDRMSWLDAWIEVPRFCSEHLLVLLVMVWGLLALGALSLMTKQHLVSIAKNLTVNEQLNWRRYAYLASHPTGATGASTTTLTNPFDRGVWHNVREFWCRNSSKSIDYRTTFRVPSPRGVATVPETHRADSKDVHFQGVVSV